ncbi:hypothetical protein DBV05_g8754 [Lasiodiplodia theobromae]|uniref:Uncharacterized protein n=1 Tax=Lasiodiplodia theobromae TaxID=45133 RepID=A0A5N5D4R3_9PEZI|nr:hypothetical protein DBV05_g8754 [Lasiodiplodia theobromae]
MIKRPRCIAICASGNACPHLRLPKLSFCLYHEHRTSIWPPAYIFTIPRPRTFNAHQQPSSASDAGSGLSPTARTATLPPTPPPAYRPGLLFLVDGGGSGEPTTTAAAAMTVCASCATYCREHHGKSPATAAGPPPYSWDSAEAAAVLRAFTSAELMNELEGRSALDDSDYDGSIDDDEEGVDCDSDEGEL